MRRGHWHAREEHRRPHVPHEGLANPQICWNIQFKAKFKIAFFFLSCPFLTTRKSFIHHFLAIQVVKFNELLHLDRHLQNVYYSLVQAVILT